MKVCKISQKTGRCSTTGDHSPERCEMSPKGRCRWKTMKKKVERVAPGTPQVAQATPQVAPGTPQVAPAAPKQKTMKVCKISQKTGRCSTTGDHSPERCEMSPKGKCRWKTIKNKAVPPPTRPQPKSPALPPLPKLKQVKTIKSKQPKQNKQKTQKISIMDAIQRYRREGIAYLETLDKNKIERILIKTNDAYRNKKPIITDNEYDTIEKYARENYPDMDFLNKVGADVAVDKKKVKLPYFMASMDKIKNDPQVLRRFIAKYTGPYVISDKLDGISGMYYCQTGKEPKLFTRGNGSVGQDISYLLPYIQGVPRERRCTRDLVVRGELIVPKRDYEAYKDKYSTSRIMASSIAVAKNFSKEEARKVHFVSYEQIIPDVKPSEQMRSLVEHPELEAVFHRVIPSGELNTETLSDLLLERRQRSPYDIDGIIVLNDRKYPRVEKNPEHGFAFKMLLKDQQGETLVLGVEWNASKDGYLKPRVRVETTHIGGTNINYVTGNNAKFIVDNKIGVGARVLIVRSGDVIPKIEQVVEPAQVVGMPPEGTYEWNDTHVDIRLVQGSAVHDDVEKKRIQFFFSQLGTDYLRVGNINKLYDAGYKTIRDYVHLRAADVEKVDGFKKKSAQKVEEAIQKSLREASLIDLMAASNSLGRGLGKKKLRKIAKQYPAAFNLGVSKEERLQGLLNMEGMAGKTAQKFLNNLPMYYQFAEENDLPTPALNEQPPVRPVPENENIPAEPVAGAGAGAGEVEGAVPPREQTMTGVRVLFTGFRDKDLESLIEAKGGELASSVSKNLSVLVVKPRAKPSGKMKKAEALGIPIMTRDEFVAYYNL
jgi:DNA ligase (NAD+)